VAQEKGLVAPHMMESTTSAFANITTRISISLKLLLDLIGIYFLFVYTVNKISIHLTK